MVHSDGVLASAAFRMHAGAALSGLHTGRLLLTTTIHHAVI
jgi:hypothetical protein